LSAQFGKGLRVDLRNAVMRSRMLFRKFSAEPQFKCLFRVRFSQAALDSLPAGKLRKLTVFGTAVRPLGDDGFVDVAAIAVF
jgi:hypothetical protein